MSKSGIKATIATVVMICVVVSAMLVLIVAVEKQTTRRLREEAIAAGVAEHVVGQDGEIEFRWKEREE